MKKLLKISFAFALGMISINQGFSQVEVGARVGVNLNQFQQPGTTVGYNAGVFASYQVLPFLGVKIEPHYSLEGGGRPDYVRDYSDISDNIDQIVFMNPSVNFHTIQVPLLVELSLPSMSEEAIRPVLILGASYGVSLLSMEQHTKRYIFPSEMLGSSVYYPPGMDVSYQRENVTDNYARNQWSMLAGFGLKMKTASRNFAFDVRYRHGLNNLNQLRFASPGNGIDLGVPGTGGQLFSSTISLNLSMSIFNF